MLADYKEGEGYYRVDNSPEYVDTTIVKIDYYDDEEADDNLASRETSKSYKGTPDTDRHESKRHMARDKYFHPLKARVTNRINMALWKAGHFCACDASGKDAINDSKVNEVLEFIKVLTNGAPVFRTKIKESTKRPLNVKTNLKREAYKKKSVSSTETYTNYTHNSSA